MNSQFRKLRRQLTALAAAVVAVVLVALTLIILHVFASDVQSREEASFQSEIGTVCQSLQQAVVSHSALRQTAARSGLLLRVFDGGTPLLFQQLSENEETARLLDLAEQAAASQCGVDVRTARAPKTYTEHREFTLRANGSRYLCSAALIPGNGGTLSAVILHPLAASLRRVRMAAVIFACADLAALLLLTLFFWQLIGKMLHPLEVMQKKQTDFVAAASHELRSPLAVILSSVDAVRNGSLPADGAFLDGVTAEGTRLSHLIGDMLSLANADAHTWRIARTKVQLDTLLLNVYETFEPLAQANGLHWSISLPEDAVPAADCDEERIRQLLGILIDNAFSYTPRGGAVALSLAAAGGAEGGGAGRPEAAAGGSQAGRLRRRRETAPARPALRLSVADNGPGIPDDKKEAVFDRFYRADPARSDRQHFGLGLSIAREIANLHKGQLLLTDTPGGGATFTLVLPL